MWASFFGGLLGGLFLILVTGPLAAIALAFGPWEYFSLFVLAMAMVAGLTEASLIKGLLSTAIGLFITVIGTDPIGGVPRFTFGSEFIGGGFPFLPVLIGIFAFAQIMTDVEKMRQPGAQGEVLDKRPSLSVDHLKVICEILGRPFLFLWSVIVGILIGVLPAIGGSAASVMAYDQAKKFSKTPELFGTGPSRGHHRLGSLQQRQRRRLARHHHGVRHSGRRGDGGDAGRDDHPRHPVGTAVRLAAPHARLRHLRGLHPGASADGGASSGSAHSSCCG